MLLTNRAEPSSDAATTALAALAAADPAAAAAAAAATVPGGPGRWLLPAADAGEVSMCWLAAECCQGHALRKVAAMLPPVLVQVPSALRLGVERPTLPHPTTAGFDDFAAALAAVDTISTLDTLSSSVQGGAGQLLLAWVSFCFHGWRVILRGAKQREALHLSCAAPE